MILRKIHEYTDNIVVRYADNILTYGELDRLSDIVRCFLYKMNLKDQLICICFEDLNIRLIITIIGILKYEGNMILLNSNSRSFEYKLKTANPKLIINVSSHNTKIIDKMINYSKIIEFVKKNKFTAPTKMKRNLNKIFLTVYTSGSTGIPKRTHCKYGNIDTYIKFLEENYSLKGNIAGFINPEFLYFWDILISTLTFGLTLCISKTSDKKNIFIRQNKINILFLTPSQYYYYFIDKDKRYPSVKYVFYSGEELKTLTAKDTYNTFPNCLITNLYGASETPIEALYHKVKNIPDSAIPIGRPIHKSIKVSIINNQIHISSPYFKHNTEDFGYIDKNNDIMYTGRSIIKINGKRVNTSIIEDIITNSYIIENNEKLVLYYVNGEDKIVVYNRLKVSLDSYMMPSYIVKLDSFPYTETGKIDKKRLPNPTDEDNIINIVSDKSLSDIHNILSNNIITRLRRISHNKPFLEFRGNIYTFGDVDNLSDNIVGYYKDKVNMQDKIVVIADYDRPDTMITIIFAIWKLGCIVAILDKAHRTYRDKIDLIDPKIIIDPNNLPTFPKVTERVSISIKDEDIALITFTSGSTGKYKVVLRPHYTIRLMYEMTCPIGERMMTLNSYDVITFCSLMVITLGYEKIFVLPDKKINANNAYELLHKNKVDYFETTPSFMKHIISKKGYMRNKMIKYISLIGETLSYDVVDMIIIGIPDVNIINTYGMTEAGKLTYHVINNRDRINPIPIGIPVHKDIDILLLNKDGTRCKVNETGRIYIHIKIFSSYDDKKLQLLVINNRSYIRTGDMGRYLQNGEIQFVNRDIFKKDGYIINFNQIKEVLQILPYVKNCAVNNHYDLVTDKQQLVIYLIIDDNISKLDIYSYLKKKLDRYMLPNWIVYIKELPYNDTGKIDRKLLPKPKFKDSILSLQEEIMHIQNMNNNDIRYIINSIIEDVSGVKIENSDISFSNYGIDSLEAIIINKIIGKTYNLEFSDTQRLVDLYDTMNKLVKFINEKIDNTDKTEERDIYKFLNYSDSTDILFVLFMGINNGMGALKYKKILQHLGIAGLIIYHPNYTKLNSYQDYAYSSILKEFCDQYKKVIFIGNSGGCEGVIYYNELCDIGVSSGAPLYTDPILLNKATDAINNKRDIRFYYGNSVDYKAIMRYPTSHIYSNPNYSSNSHGIFSIKMDYTDFFNSLIRDLSFIKNGIRKDRKRVGVLFYMHDFYKKKIEYLGYDCYTNENRYDYDIILTKPGIILNRDTLKRYEKLRLISICGAGKDNIDKEYCNKNNIVIRNIDDHKPVIEYILGMLIYELRRLGSNKIGKSLDSSIIGIIGYGNIGKNLDKILQIFKAKTMIFSKTVQNNKLEDIFKRADAVVICIPFNDSTKKIINYDLLSKMKEDAVVISISRAHIFNINDLCDVLNKKKIRLVADIMDEEIINILSNCPNTSITNHIASITTSSIDDMLNKAIKNIEKI